ncbi:hypothetical protein SDC9_175267 [bioreactor metagenome]|uniref:Uncharacterized protein n=1 Tax=bioreactor metagenome TaxID=1076179 RepID=A0A645GW08_9ZZZZ
MQVVARHTLLEHPEHRAGHVVEARLRERLDDVDPSEAPLHQLAGGLQVLHHVPVRHVL